MGEILLWVLGLIIGALLFNMVILPLFYSLPKSVYWVVNERLSGGAIWYYFSRFILANVILILLVALISNIFPSLRDLLSESEGFLYGQWIGIAMFLIYTLTSKGRNDLKEDFWTIMNRKYKIDKN